MSREIENECGFCGQHISFPEEGAGQTVDCPNCGKPIVLGMNPIEVSEDEAEELKDIDDAELDEKFEFAYFAECEHCKRRIVFPSFAMKATIACPHCGLTSQLDNGIQSQILIHRDQLESLTTAIKIRMADAKKETQIQNGTQIADSHPVFAGMSCLVQLIILIVIIAVIIAIVRFVFFQYSTL